MKKAILVLTLVALLMALTLSFAFAAMDPVDPCTPGFAQSEHAKCMLPGPPGLVGNDNGKAGDSWTPPQ